MSKSETEKNFTNYNLRELLNMDRGITELIQLITCSDHMFDEKQMTSVYHVVLLQSDIQKEIMSRIPENIQEYGFNK